MADADESMAARFASTLIQRGYDNVFVLSGGLRVAKIKFPEQLVTPPQHDVDDEDLFDEQIGEERVRKKYFEKFVLICFLNLYVVLIFVWPTALSESKYVFVHTAGQKI